MDIQRTLLRALLWMLALAAAAGVMAVFMSRDVMGRVAGTALLTAVACGLAMPVSRRLDEAATRPGGLVGLASIVVAYIVAAVAIWVDVIARGWEISFRLVMTSLVVVVGGQIAGRLLNMLRGGAGRLAARTGFYIDVVAAGLFLGAIWSDLGSFLNGSVSEKLAMTGMWLLATGAPASLALIGSGARDRGWRWLGVLMSAGALAMAVAGVWYLESKDPTWFIVVMTVAVVIGYANVAVRVPLGDFGFWARLVAVGSTASTGGCLAALSYITEGFGQQVGETLARVTGASGIVAACSTVALLILYRLNRRAPGVSKNIAEITAVQVVCPHCGRKHAAGVVESACPGCGLFVTVRVREPRCLKCDYPLLDIKGGRCPECGAGSAAVAG